MRTRLSQIGQLALISTLSFATAAASADGQREGKRRGPPPQAFEACAELVENDTCEVQTRRGDQLNGQCRVPRRFLRQQQENADAIDETDIPLVCVPERRLRRGQSELR